MAPVVVMASLLAEEAVRVRTAAVAYSWRSGFGDCRRWIIGLRAPASTMLILFLKHRYHGGISSLFFYILVHTIISSRSYILLVKFIQRQP